MDEAGLGVSVDKAMSSASIARLASRWSAGGDQRAMQLVVRLLQADDSRPAPKAPERLGEGDKIVMAELVRRIRATP